MSIRAAAITVLASATAACAQQTLYAIDFNGSLYTINTTTGAGSPVAFTGFNRLNAAAADDTGSIYAGRFRLTTDPTDNNQLIRINPATGAGTLVANYGSLNDLRGLAFANGVLYGIIDGVPDSLVSIDRATGNVTLIGGTGRSDIQGLTADGAGRLFGVGVSGTGGTLYAIDPNTGIANIITNAMNAGMDVQAIEWFDGLQAWVARTNLQVVNLTTGQATLVGPMGIADVRGLALVGAGTGGCYPNCDGSSVPPILNIDDFTCFINEFAAGQALPQPQQITHYANCDQSTIAPVLNIDDFTCFINLFAQGCP